MSKLNCAKKTFNTKNETIKSKYINYLENAKNRKKSTLKSIIAIINLYDSFFIYGDLSDLSQYKAIKFKKFLKREDQNGKNIYSPATIKHMLYVIKNFFVWLQKEPSKKKINLNDVDYLNPSTMPDIRSYKEPAKLEEIKKAIMAMPTATVYNRRDRAVIALGILTGIRVTALISLRIRHCNLSAGFVDQNPSQVHTKAGKHILTFFFPVGGNTSEIVRDWITELQTIHNFGPDDPIFPRTIMRFDHSGRPYPVGLGRKCWSTANTVRKIYKSAFSRVGLPYYTPHSFRSTLVSLGEQICRTAEEFKAWSQNLGHSKVQTTFSSYGHVPPERQGKLLKAMAPNTSSIQSGNNFSSLPGSNHTVTITLPSSISLSSTNGISCLKRQLSLPPSQGIPLLPQP